MEKDLKKRSVIKILVGVLVLVLCIVIGIIGSDDTRNFIFAPNITYKEAAAVYTYNLGNKSKYYSEDLVRCDVFYIYDVIASDDDGSYYLMPYGEDEFVTIFVENKYADKFTKVLDGTTKVINNEIESPDWQPVKARFAVYPSSDILYEYAFEYLQYDDSYTDEEIDALLLPYTFYYNDLDEWITPYPFIFIIGGIIGLAYCLITGLSYVPNFRKSVEKEGIDWDTLSEEYDYGTPFAKNRVGSRYTIIPAGNKCSVVDNSRIVWAFLFTHTTTYRTYGIKTGTSVTFSVKLACDNGRFYMMEFGSAKSEAERLLDYIGQRFPRVILGHTDQLAMIYSSDPSNFTYNVSKLATENSAPPVQKPTLPPNNPYIPMQ